jgi:RNA polymerase sigma factor (sigma-70 family)
VRRYVWRRNPGIVDDVVSETFLVAWRRLEDVPAAARPWLIAVARNVSLNVRRGVRRQQAVVERLVATEPGAESQGHEPQAEVVRSALARLSDRDREVLLLAAWDDLNRSEIAQVLGCSEPNVSLRLHRARRRFAAAVDGLHEAGRLSVSSSLISGGADVSL